MIEAAAGSLIVWHSNLWHGAVPRTADGTRVTLVMFAMRSQMRTQEDYAFTTTREMIERSPARFSVLTGLLSEVSWAGIGPPSLPHHHMPTFEILCPTCNLGLWSSHPPGTGITSGR